jgi:hypothetical protein
MKRPDRDPGRAFEVVYSVVAVNGWLAIAAQRFQMGVCHVML